MKVWGRLILCQNKALSNYLLDRHLHLCQIYHEVLVVLVHPEVRLDHHVQHGPSHPLCHPVHVCQKCLESQEFHPHQEFHLSRFCLGLHPDQVLREDHHAHQDPEGREILILHWDHEVQAALRDPHDQLRLLILVCQTYLFYL
jgi:hypothetical protein